jgi:hypothetical protein
MPNPRQTLAVLIGASWFGRAPKLAQGRAFYNSAHDFHEYLTSSAGLCLARENVNWLFDDSRLPSDQLQDIRDFLERRSADLGGRGTPPEDLIVHYVGHGLFWGSDQAYCLAVRATDERSEGLTSVRVGDLAAIIKAHATFLRKILILDCCFSAAAYKEFQSGPLEAARVKLLEELPKRGTTLLCSASAQDASLAPEGLSRTMFSDALLKALHQGHSFLGPRLSVWELGDLVKELLQKTYPTTWVRPEVHSPDQREGDIAGIPLFPNAAYLARKTGETQQTAEERLDIERLAAERADAERREQERAKQDRLTRGNTEALRLAVDRATAEGEAGKKPERPLFAGNAIATEQTFRRSNRSRLVVFSIVFMLLGVGSELSVGNAFLTNYPGWLYFVGGAGAGLITAALYALFVFERFPVRRRFTLLFATCWAFGWMTMAHWGFDPFAGMVGAVLIPLAVLVKSRK